MRISVHGHGVGRGALLVAVLLLSTACIQESETSDQIAVQTRAARLLDELRAERWSEAAEFVFADKVTRERMEIPEAAGRDETREEIARWFEALYGKVPPGVVHSVEVSAQDPTFALVTYRAGDLDAFTMRFVDGEWYYTLE